jgi:uncharacterized protein YqgV (UPF0045/DUF77 family)
VQQVQQVDQVQQVEHVQHVQQVRVEFTVEPFREGQLGAHVDAALRSLRDDGFEPEVGPFGNAVEGDAGVLLAAVARAALASFGAGASGISVTARAIGDEDASAFLAAVGPLARALGGRIVPAERMGHSSVPLVWKGRVVGGIERSQSSDLRNGLSGLVADVEVELGGCLATLSRVDKQRAVRLLDERGAFAIRNAVDEVADAMGVSRVTVYNYLNATRASSEP